MFNNFRALIGALALSALLLGGATAASAQTIGQTSSDTLFGNSGQGQSFTATVTGTITQIQVRPGTSVLNDTLRFYSGDTGTSGTLLYTQTVTTVGTADSAAPLQTFVLSTPLSIVAGNTYSLSFVSTQLRISGANTYAQGTWIFQGNNSYSHGDAAFLVTQVAAPVAAPVPTMSEWAMILLGLTLAGGAAFYIQRRSLTA